MIHGWFIPPQKAQLIKAHLDLGGLLFERLFLLPRRLLSRLRVRRVGRDHLQQLVTLLRRRRDHHVRLGQLLLQGVDLGGGLLKL